MFLNKYLSEYDDSLTGESYIDPMGMLVIWSAFGQQIFRSRVNSISNDVRNYTLNLFNHYLIRRLINDDSVNLKGRLSSVYGSKDQLIFKNACLLYLEGLFVYSIIKHDGKNDVDSGGVLGITKARRTWNDMGGNPRLVFSHGKESQILVRQLSLGVSGRYKTPLMEIGYFDPSYHYRLPRAARLWEDTEQFIENTPALKNLANKVFEHLKSVLQQNTAKPFSDFNGIPPSIHKAYAKAFASPGRVGSYARGYWLNATNLDEGAAGALLQVLDENAKLAKPKELASQQIIARALGKALPAEEAQKLQHITLIEPFLAEVSLLFNLLTTHKSQPLKDVIGRWKDLQRDEQTLPQLARRVLNEKALMKVVSGSAYARLTRLLKLADCMTFNEQIELLLTYHSQVMRERGQTPWLSIDVAGQVKIFVRPSSIPDKQQWCASPSPWVNSYYLPQFKSLVRGYRGVSA